MTESADSAVPSHDPAGIHNWLSSDWQEALRPKVETLLSGLDDGSSRLYFLQDWIAAVSNQSQEMSVSGEDGHGINSHAWHSYVVEGALAYFGQNTWHGAYTDAVRVEQQREARQQRFTHIRAGIREAVAAGRTGPDERLVVIDTAVHRSGAIWLGARRPRVPMRPPYGGVWAPKGLPLSDGFDNEYAVELLLRHLETRQPGDDLNESVLDADGP